MDAFVTLTEDDVPGAKLIKPARECTMIMLKQWLACRGLKVSGRRDELVERVKNALDLSSPIVHGIDQGKWYDAKQNQATGNQNLNTASTSSSDISGLEWTVFPSINIPEMFNEGNVYHFAVEQVAKLAMADDETMVDDETAKPMKKGKELFADGFVHDIGNAQDQTSYHLQAHVHHSMKGEPPLLASISLSKLTGFIQKGKCTCRARHSTSSPPHTHSDYAQIEFVIFSRNVWPSMSICAYFLLNLFRAISLERLKLSVWLNLTDCI